MATLDQQYTTQTAEKEMSKNSGGCGNSEVAATQFVAGLAGTLDSVDVYIKRYLTPSGITASISIWSDDGANRPLNILSEYKDLDHANIGTSYAWKNYVFSTKPTMVVGTKYWIVISFTYTEASCSKIVMWARGSGSNYATSKSTLAALWTDWGTYKDYNRNYKTYVNTAQQLTKQLTESVKVINPVIDTSKWTNYFKELVESIRGNSNLQKNYLPQIEVNNIGITFMK